SAARRRSSLGLDDVVHRVDLRILDRLLAAVRPADRRLRDARAGPEPEVEPRVVLRREAARRGHDRARRFGAPFAERQAHTGADRLRVRAAAVEPELDVVSVERAVVLVDEERAVAVRHDDVEAAAVPQVADGDAAAVELVGDADARRDVAEALALLVQ